MGQKWCIVYMNEKAHTNAQMWVNGTGGELISGYSQLHNCNIWRCYCAANVFSSNTVAEEYKYDYWVFAKDNSNNWTRINRPCLTCPDKCKDSILERRGGG